MGKKTEIIEGNIKAKQIGVTIPYDMFVRIGELRDEIAIRHGKRKVSQICQEAISLVLNEAEASRLYRLEGIKDGKKQSSSLEVPDKEYVYKVFSNSGPYKNWSIFDKIEEIKEYFEYRKKINHDFLYPKFMEIMSADTPPLHEWVTADGEKIAEDRRGEMAWSYVAGCYEGINEEYINNKEGNK